MIVTKIPKNKCNDSFIININFFFGKSLIRDTLKKLASLRQVQRKKK